MKQFGLKKSDKLCSPTAIDKLFSRGVNSKCENTPESTIAFPLRAVWCRNDIRQDGSAVEFLISVPKKRLRHAVDRVKMRRRIREAYRLNRHNYEMPSEKKIDLAFIYISNELKDYQSVEKSVCRILQKIAESEKNSA